MPLKVVAIIPARGGSKEVIGKNLRLLEGAPLISRPIRAAHESGAVDAVFVTTDSDEIAAAARAAGADVPFLRPPELAADDTTMEATLQHALNAYEEHLNVRFDICVFMTATDVFRKPEWVAQAVKMMHDRLDLESVFVGKVDFKNYWEALPEGGYQRVCPYMQVYGQRQERLREKRVVYREDTGLACASRAWLWRIGRRIGDKVEIIPNEDPASDVDINTEFDLMLAEFIVQWRKDHAKE